MKKNDISVSIAGYHRNAGRDPCQNTLYFRENGPVWHAVKMQVVCGDCGNTLYAAGG